MDDITNADLAHTKRVCKDFEIKNLGKYHDLYVQRDTLLLADVFENFRRAWSCNGLVWKAAFKKAKVELDLLTDIDMLLIVERGIKGEIHIPLFINILKLITNTWKIMTKIKNLHRFNIGM